MTSEVSGESSTSGWTFMAYTSTNMTAEAPVHTFTTHINMAEKSYQVQFPVIFVRTKVIQEDASISQIHPANLIGGSCCICVLFCITTDLPI